MLPLNPTFLIVRTLKEQRHLVKLWKKSITSGFLCLHLFSTNKTEDANTQSSSTNELASSSPLRLSHTTYPGHPLDVNKRPVVFLHGLFGAKGNLHSVSRQLADDGRLVTTFDARNHGDSQHSPEMNYSVMADDLLRLIQDVHLTAPVVMGHSMGGKTAMTFSLAHPEQLSGLIVVDVSPSKSPGVQELKLFAEAMRNVKIVAGTTLAQARQQVQAQLSAVVQNPAILQFLLTNLRQFEGGNVRWRNNLDAFINNHKDIEDIPLHNVRPFVKPTLFVFGEKSQHYREHDADKIKELFPRSEITVIKKAGHFVHADQPSEFVSVVRQFLQDLDGSVS